MADDADFISKYGLVPRSRSELLDLPLQYRWEFTRRHPYYLLFWRWLEIIAKTNSTCGQQRMSLD